MPSDASSWGDPRRMVPTSIQGLVHDMGLPYPDNDLNVLHLEACGFTDRHTLIEGGSVLTSELAEAKSKASKACCLE